MKPAQWRSLGLHLTSAGGGALAVLMWAATSDVDLYGAVKQLNVVVTEVGKLIATVAPIAAGAYQVWKASTTQTLKDVAADPIVKGVVAVPDIAEAIPSNKVVASADALPAAAKR